MVKNSAVSTNNEKANSDIPNSSRIGLFGGSFDPVHKAHMELAKIALSSLKLESLQLIPAGKPWQKNNLKATSEQRLQMLKIASEGITDVIVNPTEVNRKGATYTIETLESLPSGPKYYWIMGSDQLENFCSWHRWQDIVKHVNLAVAKRPNSALIPPAQLTAVLEANGTEMVEIPFEPMEISATNIRKRLENDQDCSKYIETEVLDYINRNNIYKK